MSLVAVGYGACKIFRILHSAYDDILLKAWQGVRGVVFVLTGFLRGDMIWDGWNLWSCWLAELKMYRGPLIPAGTFNSGDV
ncbi:MAG: hypothetical protein JW936_02160 [Sedimentisphaerales bacterium]|nr:hypothetical protein [Sedimentisphaerales bacterium]